MRLFYGFVFVVFFVFLLLAVIRSRGRLVNREICIWFFWGIWVFSLFRFILFFLCVFSRGWGVILVAGILIWVFIVMFFIFCSRFVFIIVFGIFTERLSCFFWRVNRVEFWNFMSWIDCSLGVNFVFICSVFFVFLEVFLMFFIICLEVRVIVYLK